MFDEEPDRDPHDECRAEINRLAAELDAARAVPAEVEVAIGLVDAIVEHVRTLDSYDWQSRLDDSRPSDDAKDDARELSHALRDYDRSNGSAFLRAAIARAIAEARQPATVGGLLAHLASGKPFTSPRWLAGHVLRVDAATGRLWRLDYNDPDEMHLTRYVLSDRAFSISDVLAADYVVVADTPVMDHAWRTRPASRGPLPKGG